jgi:hypothetical protein
MHTARPKAVLRVLNRRAHARVALVTQAVLQRAYANLN